MLFSIRGPYNFMHKSFEWARFSRSEVILLFMVFLEYTLFKPVLDAILLCLSGNTTRRKDCESVYQPLQEVISSELK